MASKINFKPVDVKLQLKQINGEHKWAYVSEFWDEYKEFLEQFDCVCIWAQKGSGKSQVFYDKMTEIIQKKAGLIQYGRLQLQEKQNMYGELFKYFQTIGLSPHKCYGLGKDYIGFNQIPTIKLVNISSYQGIRGAIAEGQVLPSMIWYDEINAYTFPKDFEFNLLNTLSTFGRDYQYKFYASGNDETAANNPVLSALQLKFNWTFSGLQLAYRVVQGVKVLGIHMGGECFDKVKRPPSIAERLASNNPELYQVFYQGQANINGQENVISLNDDKIHDKIKMYWAIDERVYAFWTGKVTDDVNNVVVDNAFIVEYVPDSYNSDKVIKSYGKQKIPFYTTSPIADLYFPDVVWLDQDRAANILTGWSSKLKYRQLFFGSFKARDDLMAILVRNNWYYKRNKEEL